MLWVEIDADHDLLGTALAATAQPSRRRASGSEEAVGGVGLVRALLQQRWVVSGQSSAPDADQPIKSLQMVQKQKRTKEEGANEKTVEAVRKVKKEKKVKEKKKVKKEKKVKTEKKEKIVTDGKEKKGRNDSSEPENSSKKRSRAQSVDSDAPAEAAGLMSVEYLRKCDQHVRHSLAQPK